MRLKNWLAYTLLLGIALGTLAACGGKKQTGSGPLDGYLDLDLKGRIATPSAIVGGLVVAFALDDAGNRIELLSTLVSPSGAFELSLDGYNPDYPLVLCTRGDGTYVDSWTGQQAPLTVDSELCAAFIANNSLDESLLFVDVWSTLAFSLAQGAMDPLPEGGITATAFGQSLATANDRLAQHLYRDAPPQLGFTDPADPSLEPLYFPSARGASGLAAAGLAHIAHQWPAGKDGTQPTALDLVTALARDARDGVFDGWTDLPEGSLPVMLANTPLTGDELRLPLARAIHAFVTEREVSFGNDFDAPVQFNTEDGWYEQLSTASGPLFGPLPGPVFDPLPPVITPVSGFPEPGELLTEPGEITLVIAATDPHGVASLQLALPEEYEGAKVTTDGPNRWTMDLPFDPEAVEELNQLFAFEATDLAGNTSTAELTFTVAIGGPAIAELIPPSEACLEEAPDELLVFAGHEDFLDIEVALEHEGTRIDCPSEIDGFHHCVDAFYDGYVAAVVVTDELGKELVEPWTICIDNTPPTLTFVPADGAWHGPELPLGILVQMEDDHKVSVVAVTINGDTVDVQPQKTQFEVELPATEASLAVTIADIAGHQTDGLAVYPYDETPPVIETPVLGIVTDNFDYITHIFQVDDAGSGIATVKLIGGEGLWNLEMGDDGYHLVGTVDPQPGVPPHVVVEAEDMVGNVTSQVFNVYLDTSTPSISQITSLVTDDDTVVPGYDEATGEVSYQSDGAVAVSFNATTCQQGCPAVAKYAPLLFDDGLLESDSPDIVAFKFVLSDPCPTGAIKPTLSVQPEWYADEQLIYAPPAFPANCGGNVTVTIPLLLPLDDTGTALFPSGLVPNGLRLSVSDLGGQTAVADVPFELAVLPPPLFVLDTPETLPDDMLSELLDSQFPQLHIAVNEGGAYRRLPLTNPTTVPVSLTLDALPTEYLFIAHSRVYVEPVTQSGASCSEELCSYEGIDGVDQCVAPIGFAADTLYANPTQTARLRRVVDGVGSVLMPSNGFELGPSESTTLDLMTGALESPLKLDPAQTFALEDNSGVKLHLASPDIAHVSCTGAGLPPSSYHHDVPDIVWSYSVKLVAGSSLSLTTSLTDVEAETGALVLPADTQTYSYLPAEPPPTTL